MKRRAAAANGAAERGPRERGGIQSLERAFAILEAIARSDDGIGLAELGKAVGLHNSTTFHLAKTMAQLGYVAQDSESRRYRVGSRLFTLAAGALDEKALLLVATPVLESLTATTGESAHFAIRTGRDIVVIARTAGAGLLQMAVRTGSPRPAHATALGKVLMSALSDAEIKQLLGKSRLESSRPERSSTSARCCARSPRFERRALPSTTPSSTRKSAAERCLSAISPAGLPALSGSRVRSGAFRCRRSTARPGRCSLPQGPYPHIWDTSRKARPGLPETPFGAICSGVVDLGAPALRPSFFSDGLGAESR